MNKPAIGVAAIVFHQNKVLLVQRANEPGKDQWSFPGGKLHAGETLKQAAERETLEETGVKVSANSIAHTFEMIEYDDNQALKFHYIIIDLEATYLAGQAEAGDDALDARWVSMKEMASLNIHPETRTLLSDKYHFA